MSGIVAGVGFRHGTEPEEIAELIRRALAEAGVRSDQLSAVATAEDRAEEACVIQAAAAFGLRPVGVAAEALADADARVETRSARIEATRGVGSVAEAAALAAAGDGSRLVLPRIADPSATCALAAPLAETAS